MKVALDVSWKQVHGLVDWALPIADQAKGVVLILIAAVMIYAGLVSLVNLLRTRAKKRAEKAVHWALDRKPGRQVGRLGHFLRSLAVLCFPGAGRIHVRIIWLND